MAKMSSGDHQLIQSVWGSITGSNIVPGVMQELLEEAYRHAYDMSYMMDTGMLHQVYKSPHGIFVEEVKKLAEQYSQQVHGYFVDSNGFAGHDTFSNGPTFGPKYTSGGGKYHVPMHVSTPSGNRSWVDTDQQLREACPSLYSVHTTCPHGKSCPFGSGWQGLPQPLNQVVMHLNDNHKWPRTSADSVDAYARIQYHIGVRIEPFELFPNVADWLDYMATKEGWDLSFKTPEEVQADKDAEAERTSKNQAKALLSLGVDQHSFYEKALKSATDGAYEMAKQYMTPEWKSGHVNVSGDIDWDNVPELHHADGTPSHYKADDSIAWNELSKLTGYHVEEHVIKANVPLSPESVADGSWLKGWPVDKHPLPSKVVDHGHGVYEFKYTEGE